MCLKPDGPFLRNLEKLYTLLVFLKLKTKLLSTDYIN